MSTPVWRTRRVIAATISALLLLGALVLLGGCGIGSDDAPRDIVVIPRDDSSGQDAQTGITATSTSVIYLLEQAAPDRVVLTPVARDVAETIDNALSTLFYGPTARELNADLSTAIPSSVRLLNATPNGDVVTVDVTDGMGELSGMALVDAVAQIVLTATDVAGVASVVITIAGATIAWPLADGTTSSDPLTRDDYSALLATSDAPTTDPTVAPTTPHQRTATDPTPVASVQPPAPSGTGG